MYQNCPKAGQWVDGEGYHHDRCSAEYTSPTYGIEKPNGDYINGEYRVKVDEVGFYKGRIFYQSFVSCRFLPNRADFTASYRVNVNQINTEPKLTLTNSNFNVGSNKSVTIKGTVQDNEGDNVTVSATLNGKTKTQTVTNTTLAKPFTLTWNTSELGNTTYTTIPVKANDGTVTTTSNYTGKITVDKVPPVLTVSKPLTTPTNKNITVSATTNKGTVNKASHTFTQNGSFTFTATSSTGEVSSQTVTVNNIDKTKPKLNIQLK